MNWADYGILAIVALSALIGGFRGFTREALGLATWIFAILLAVFLGRTLAVTLEPHIGAPMIRIAVAYGGLFLVGLLIGGIMTAIVVSRVRESRFSSTDRTMGAGLGLIRGVVITGLAVMIGMMTAIHEAPWWQQSKLIGPAESVATSLRAVIPAEWLEPIETGTLPLPKDKLEPPAKDPAVGAGDS